MFLEFIENIIDKQDKFIRYSKFIKEEVEEKKYGFLIGYIYIFV